MREVHACAVQALVWLMAVASVLAQAPAAPGARLLCAGALIPFAWRAARCLLSSRLGRRRALRCVPVDAVAREARAHPTLQWMGHGVEWTARRAAAAHAAGADPARRWPPPFARVRPIRVPHAVLSSHLLVFGQTGSGKTRLASLLAASYIARHPDGALIVFDPKGDADLRSACARCGRPRSFIELDLARPAASVRFDPMRNHVRTTSLASRLAALLPEARSGSPFAAFAWRQLLVLADALLYVGDRPTLAALRAAVEGDGRALLARALETWSRQPGVSPGPVLPRATVPTADAALAGYRDAVRARPSCAEPVIDGLAEVVAHDRAHRSKMIQTLLPLLAALTTRDLRALLSPAADAADPRPVFDSHKVIEQARVLYIGLDVLADPMAGAALGSLVLADLAQVAGQRARTGGVPVQVMVDEAAELAGEPLLQLLNKSRGAGFQLVLAAQTVHDFEARLGNAAMANALLGNPGNVIALRTADPRTQRFFSDALMPILGTERGEGRSAALEAAMNRQPAPATASWQARQAAVDWVPPGALSQLPDLHFFARTADGRVWRGALPGRVAPR